MENLIKNIKHKKHKIKFKEKHKLIKDESNDIDEIVNLSKNLNSLKGISFSK